MAKDRMIFLLSFAFLGLVAAFLFKGNSVSVPQASIETGDQKAIGLVIPVKEHKKVDYLPGPGKVAVPYQLTNRSGMAQFMSTGNFVDIAFTSKEDLGFGRVSFTLLKAIKILGIGKNSEGNIEYYKNNAPTEILLEMTPRQAEIFSYAQSSGEVSLGIMDKAQDEKESNLANKLLESRSDENFNSILITHAVSSLFPHAKIEVLATQKGYVVKGKVPNAQTAQKIVKVLDLMSTGGEKSVVSLIEDDPYTIGENNSKSMESLAATLAPGKTIIPFQITTRSPIAQTLIPGMEVGVKFTSKDDIGFGTISFYLLNQVRVVSIGLDAEGRPFNKNTCMFKACSPLEVYLEMTPHDAEILTYAQTAGQLTLEIAENHPIVTDPILIKQLSSVDSGADFHSVLVTHMIRTLFPDVDVNITAAPSGYILQGKVSDPQVAAKVVEIIARLVPGGEKSMVNMLEVSPQQVLLCVKVFEVSKDFRASIGVNWKLLFENNGASVAAGAVYPAPDVGVPTYYIDASGVHFGNFTLSGLINLIQEQGCGTILAEPNLTTLSGQKAYFFAGGEFPILIPQASGGIISAITVEYKKYGITLEFTPFVDLSGLIQLNVMPEVSNLDRENSVRLYGYDIPGLLVRKANTVVKLWPGQSYIIAGLIGEEFQKHIDQLCGFSDIPILGTLFNSKRYRDRQTELMIVVTPFLVRNESCSECEIVGCSTCSE